VRRALFVVRQDDTTVINLSPTLRVLSVALEVTSKGSRDLPSYNYVPKYDDVKPFGGSPLNIVIEYRKKTTKTTKPDVTEYRNAKLSYDSYSVSADVIRLDRKSLSFEASGNVTADVNGKRQKTDKLSSKIISKQPASLGNIRWSLTRGMFGISPSSSGTRSDGFGGGRVSPDAIASVPFRDKDDICTEQ
jgi:hypothetical protein